MESEGDKILLWIKPDWLFFQLPPFSILNTSLYKT